MTQAAPPRERGRLPRQFGICVARVRDSDAHAVPPRMLIDLGLAEAGAGEPTSPDRFAQALEMVTEPDERADALYSLGQTLHAIGRFAEASAAFRHGATLVDDDTQAWLRFHGAAASAEFFITTPAQRMQPEIIRPMDLADGSGTRVVLAVKSLQEAVSVPPAQWAGDLAMRALGDGALLAEQTSQGPSVNLAVQALLYAGRLSEAQKAADAAVRDARERGALLRARRGKLCTGAGPLRPRRDHRSGRRRTSCARRSGLALARPSTACRRHQAPLHGGTRRTRRGGEPHRAR